jgi:hypothetical protein
MGWKMKIKFLALWFVVVIFAVTPATSQSATVTFTFLGTVLDGPLSGSTGEGSITFDTDSIINPDEIIDPTDGLEITFVFNGQNFDQTNDEGFNDYPTLGFEDSIPFYLDYFLIHGVNGVNFSNPFLASLSTDGLLPSSGNFDFTTEIFTVVVPVPGALVLFGSGVAGLVGLRIRKRYKA